MKTKLQLALAIIVAALFSDISDKTTWRRALGLFTIWFGKDGVKVSEEHYQRRMSACHECPVFYKRLQTCGSPLSKELKGLGCSCFLPVKSRYVNSSCWIDDNVSECEHGWHERDGSTG